MSAEEITGLLAGMSRELRCSQCLENFKEATTTFCGHTFCKECIETEMETNQACPTCNQPLDAQKLHLDTSLQEIVEQFKIMRDQYQISNDVILSQTPIKRLSQDTPLEQSLPQPSPVITNNEGPLSDVRRSPEDSSKPAIVYAGKDVPTIECPGLTFVDEIDERTTHVVLKSTEKNREMVECSEDYVLGILHGCSIVQSAWLERCSQDKKIFPTKRFEITGDIEFGRTGAPEKSKKYRDLRKDHRLFRGVRVKFINDDKITRQYEKYVRIGGGTVTEHGEIIVCAEEQDDIDLDELQEKYPEGKFLYKGWIDECICLYEVVKKEKYIL